MIPSFLKTNVCFAKFNCLIAATIILAAATTSAHGEPNTRVKAFGFNLQLNGKPLVIKGMNYSPVPIGTAPGFIPYGDYFIPYYANVWKPDVDKIREAGVNVIKLYAGNPDLNAGAPGTAGNWKDFLDYCYNGGNRPVYVVMFSYTQGGVIAQGGTGLNDYIRQYDKLVKSTVKHPAVFGYMIGNEIFDGVTGNAQFWQNFGTLIDAAQGAGLSQGEKPFLTTATNDNFTPQETWPAIKRGEQSGKLNNIDAWTINIYRGPEFGGANNSVFTQYAALMRLLPGPKKPLILGEWGTPHTTRPVGVYGTDATTPVTNLDDVPESQMGTGQPYFAAQPVATFLNTQWNTIKANLAANRNDQVCAGGFIFDWCDEYWKANNNNVQVGGPQVKFQGGAFAGGYWDEAGFGVTGAVDQSTYGQGKPNISRTLYKGYDAVKTFYNASSQSGAELYQPPQGALDGVVAAIHRETMLVREALDVDDGAVSLRRWLKVRLRVLSARLIYPGDEVLERIDERILDAGTSMSPALKRNILTQLNARLRELRGGG